MNFKKNRKTWGFFLSVLISIFCLGSLWGITPANANAVHKQSQSNVANEDLLASWNDGGSKDAIVDFVNKVVADGVPEKDRIAVFDNDGTLWAERPNYFQEDFIHTRLENLPQAKVSKFLKTTQKQIEKKQGHTISEEGKTFLKEIPLVNGLTTGEYNSLAQDFLHTKHNELASVDDGDYKRFDTEYINLTYKPVIELVNYLKDNSFKVYICSGGGIYFVRSFSEEVYAIPTEEVIGSAIQARYDEFNTTDGTGGSLVRTLGLAHYDDQEGKPVGIELFIGKRPIIAVGNSSGDFEMFKYSDAGVDKSLIVLINHDDCDREYKYNDVVGSTHKEIEDGEEITVADNESLDEAQNRDNWIVVSMKDDFQTIFESNPQRPIPSCPIQ